MPRSAAGFATVCDSFRLRAEHDFPLIPWRYGCAEQLVAPAV